MLVSSGGRRNLEPDPHEPVRERRLGEVVGAVDLTSAEGGDPLEGCDR